MSLQKHLILFILYVLNILYITSIELPLKNKVLFIVMNSLGLILYSSLYIQEKYIIAGGAIRDSPVDYENEDEDDINSGLGWVL